MIFILIGQLGIKQSVSSGASVKERGSEKCMALGFKESASRWDMKVVQETRVALQVYGVFLCPHSHLPNPHYISNTLILKQRHGFDYIGSEMPPGFQWSLSFSFFFQQQYIHFFSFSPVTFGNLSVEKHCPSGEPCQGVRKMYISVELDHSKVLNLPFPPLKAGMSRPSSSCRSPFPPNPPNLSGCRKYLEQE